MPAFRHLSGWLAAGKGSVKALALEAARPYVIAAIYKRLKRPLLGAIADSATQTERLNVLSALAFGKGEAPLVVAAAPSLMHRVATFAGFSASHLSLRKDMALAPRVLLEQL